MESTNTYKALFLVAVMLMVCPLLNAQSFKPEHIEGKWRLSKGAVWFEMIIKNGKAIITGHTSINKMADSAWYENIRYSRDSTWVADRMFSLGPVDNKGMISITRKPVSVELYLDKDKYSLTEKGREYEYKRLDMYPGEQNDINQLKNTLAPCAEPDEQLFMKLCDMIELKDMKYKELLMQMACVDKRLDGPLLVKAKVQRLWSDYYKEFWCAAAGFRVDQGNILKFSVYSNFQVFVDGVVRHFNLDINIKDPADGKTLLDYLTDEINAYRKLLNSQDKFKELQELYKHYRDNLGAKHAAEIYR